MFFVLDTEFYQVAIHNNMNEGTWAKVLEWEEVIGEGPPKLVSS